LPKSRRGKKKKGLHFGKNFKGRRFNNNEITVREGKKRYLLWDSESRKDLPLKRKKGRGRWKAIMTLKILLLKVIGIVRNKRKNDSSH